MHKKSMSLHVAIATYVSTGAYDTNTVDEDALLAQLLQELGISYQLLAWSFGNVDDKGNMTASGPAFVSAGTTADITFDWAGLTSNTIYLGGISHNTPQGLSELTLITIGN